MGFKITKTKKKQESGRMLKRILSFCFAFVTVFTICEFYRVWQCGGDNSTLITCVFTFYGTELVCGAGIKIAEQKNIGGNSNGMDGK